MFSLLLRMVRERETAEDLSQEAFVKAFRALASYDPKRKFSNWLFKIAHNTAIDHLRRHRPKTLSIDDAQDDQTPLAEQLADATAVSPARQARSSAIAAAVETAIAELRDEYREVLVLRFIEGLSYQDISEVTEQPLGTVKTQIHRARKVLAEKLLEAGYEPGGEL